VVAAGGLEQLIESVARRIAATEKSFHEAKVNHVKIRKIQTLVCHARMRNLGVRESHHRPTGSSLGEATLGMAHTERVGRDRRHRGVAHWRGSTRPERSGR